MQELINYSVYHLHTLLRMTMTMMMTMMMTTMMVMATMTTMTMMTMTMMTTKTKMRRKICAVWNHNNNDINNNNNNKTTYLESLLNGKNKFTKSSPMSEPQVGFEPATYEPSRYFFHLDGMENLLKP